MSLKEKIRLNKFLASCGLGSRRAVESLVEEELVSVNGEIASFPGVLVSSEDEVFLRGERVFPRKTLYVVFNKPEGYVCSLSDPHNVTIYDILPEFYRSKARLFSIGRLDKNSQGLLLLTNDGDFSQAVGHPSQGVGKTYEVLLRHPLGQKDFLSWKDGVFLEGKKRRPFLLEYLSKKPDDCWIRLILREGLKREIRLMARYYGNEVLFLRRTAFGKLRLENLPPGKYRTFSKEQLWCMIHHGGSV